MEYVKYLKEENWGPHPAGLDGVEMNVLRSKKETDYRESIAYVRIAVAAVVPPHVHAKEDDNLFILQGRAKMRVGDEQFDIGQGAQITVPAGIEHEIFDVNEELLIYDVFAPPTF